MNRRSFVARLAIAPFLPKLAERIAPVVRKIPVTWNDIVRSTKPMWRSTRDIAPNKIYYMSKEVYIKTLNQIMEKNDLFYKHFPK